MTSKLQPASLTVTHTEAVILTDGTNDHGLGVTNTFTIASIAQATKRIVPVTTTETGLLSFATNTVTAVAATAFASGYAAGHYDEDSVRYLRVTNLDDTNHVELTFRSASSAEFAVILEHGQSYIYSCLGDTGVVATMDASSTPLTVSLENLTDITVKADTATCDVEVFVASV